jgi:hypothetical protein
MISSLDRPQDTDFPQFRKVGRRVDAASWTRFDYPQQVGENWTSPSWLEQLSLSASGPVAQLGARFHGMEEVVGSNPTRSTSFPLQSLVGEVSSFGLHPAAAILGMHYEPMESSVGYQS